MIKKALIFMYIFTLILLTGCSSNVSYEYQKNDFETQDVGNSNTIAKDTINKGSDKEIEEENPSPTDEKNETKYYDLVSNSIEIVIEDFPAEIDGYVLDGNYKCILERNNILCTLQYVKDNKRVQVILAKANQADLEKELNDSALNSALVKSSHGTFLVRGGEIVKWYTSGRYNFVTIDTGKNFDSIHNDFVEYFTDEFPVDLPVISDDAIEKLIDGLREESYSMQSVNQSQEKTTTNIEVVQIYATGTDDGKIDKNKDEIYLILRLGSVSNDVNLDDIIIKFDTRNGSQTLSYANNLSADSFQIKYLSNGNNPIQRNYISIGDMAQAKFTTIRDMEPGETATLRILQKKGSVKHFDITTPSSMKEEATYLYP